MILQPLPFYKAHPGMYTTYGSRGLFIGSDVSAENYLMQDFEYFCQLCPDKVKKYQRKIESILDKMDYEGSMIYDEYPDQFSLERTADRMAEVISTEMKEEAVEFHKEQEYPLIFLLLEIAIYKRRHSGRRKFYM